MGKNFLVICTGYFGDVILTSKLTRDIKKYYPDSKLIYICDVLYITVAQNLPGVDEVIGYNRKVNSSFFYYINFILKFPYKNQIFQAFVIHQNKKSRNFLAKILGSKKITAWEHFKCSSYYEKTLKENLKYSKIAYFNANMLSLLTHGKTDDNDIEFLIPEFAQAKIDNFLSQFKYKNLIAINPQANDGEKCWDINEFVRFTKKLIKNNYTPIITGVSKDGTKYIEAVKNDKEIKQDSYINMIDKTNFCELGALYKRCSYIVSVDTGSAHMACAVKVPTLVLFFRNDAHLWAPINTEQNSYIYNANNITAEEVYLQMTNNLKDSCYNNCVINY